MSQGKWTAVERYITDLLLPADSDLEAALEDSARGGLPPINVSPNMGKLLELLARVKGARSILEIGTLGGYSTIWLARALPVDGHLITVEADPKHAKIAHANIARAGLADVVELRLGRASDVLPQLVAERRGPFDVIFIDADKENNSLYFAWALKLSRRGSLIIVDNVVRNGGVIDAASSDASIQGVRRFMDVIAAEPHVTATAVQTVSSKGYDGFLIALVIAEQ
jgi:predicted O-methyltransferase YrrM